MEGTQEERDVMKIIRPSLLKEFAAAGRCELCGEPCLVREAHHHIRKGIGNSSQMDVRINLLSVGSTLQWACQCHMRLHDGKIPNNVVLEKIAARERQKPDDVEDVLWWISRLDGKSSQARISAALDELGKSARALAVRELVAAGKYEVTA